jgi:hypothetical protein
MSIYADLVCRSCSESFFLGKQLWTLGRIFGYWHGSAGDGGSNGNSDSLMFSLFRFFANHTGHDMQVLSETALADFDPPLKRFFDTEPTLGDLAGLSHQPEQSVLVSTGADRSFNLGRLLVRQGEPFLFSRYLDGRVSNRVFKPLWAFLARSQTGNERLRVFTAKPEWRTTTVVSLARGIHSERAWDQMPILGDALQDAGCEDNDVLSHCRCRGPHARGCWVIDAILGREQS